MLKKVLLILTVMLFAFSCNSPSNPDGNTGDGGSTGGGDPVDKNKGIEQFAGDYKGNLGGTAQHIVISDNINNGYLFITDEQYEDPKYGPGIMSIQDLNSVKSADALTYNLEDQFIFKFSEDKSSMSFSSPDGTGKLITVNFNRLPDLDSSKGIEQFGKVYKSSKMYSSQNEAELVVYTLTISASTIKIEEYNESTSQTTVKYDGLISGKGAFYSFGTDGILNTLQFFNNGNNCIISVSSYNSKPIVFKKQ